MTPDLSGTKVKCRMGTAKIFTLLLLLYLTQTKIQGMYRSNLAIIGLPLATVLVPGADMGPVAMLAAIIVPLFNVLAVITLTAFRGERLPAGRLIKMVATNPYFLRSLGRNPCICNDLRV